MHLNDSRLTILVTALLLTACSNKLTPMPTQTTQPSPPVDQVSDTLPALQVISVENAAEIQLLRTMAIPDYQQSQVSQCNPAFSPDGRLLAGACGDNPVPIWDVQTGEILQRLYDPPVQVVACAFSPDGSQLACGGFDHVVTLWETTTGNTASQFEAQSAPIWDIAFSPEGDTLVACSLGLFGAGPGRGDIRLWKLPDPQPKQVHSGSQDCLSLSFHPSGQAFAYGTIGGQVGILDSVTGQLLYELKDSHSNIGGLAYSPSGLWLAAGSDDRQIYLWETSGYELVAKLVGHTGYVNGVAFNPDETLLASGSHDQTIGVWNLQGLELITRLTGHERQVLRVAFNPNGTLIASISWDGTVRLWGVPQ